MSKPLQHEMRQAYFHRVWGAVTRACGLDPAVRTTETGRKQRVVMARYLAIFIAIEGVSLNQTSYYRQLALFFGRDRTLVYYAVRVVDNMLAVYGERWEYYQPLQRAKAMLEQDNARSESENH